MPHKKGHSWRDLAGESYKKVTGHGWRSDINPVQKHLNKKAGVADEKTAGGRIQKKLTKGGWSKTELRHKMEEHQRRKKAKADMQKWKKTKPSKYKKLKKEQRRRDNLKAFTASSSTWD